MKILLFTLAAVAAVLLSPAANAGDFRSLVADGQILKLDGTPLEQTGVVFRAQIKNPSGSCVLWDETFTVDMTGTNGFFTLNLGAGTATAGGPATILPQVFVNAGTMTGYSACLYSPATTDDRTLVLSFSTDSWATTNSVSAQTIKAVPYAMQADQIGGFGILNLPKISTAGGSAVALTKDGYEFLANLSAPTIASANATPCTNGQTLVYNGTAWICSSPASSGVTAVTATSPLASTGGTTPDLSITQATTTTNGYLSSTDWNTFNNKLNTSLTSGNIFVGSGANAATGVAMSGDATLSNAGVLTLATSGVTAATYKSVTVDAKGRVTAGTNPTTLAGYGITDAVLNTATIGLANGGTGATSAPLARTNLGLGTAATMNTGNSSGSIPTLGLTGITANLMCTGDSTGANIVCNTSMEAPTFTSIMTPLIIGGTAATSSLTYRSTSGAGATGADHIFQVGNNGTTEAMRILNSGKVGVGTMSPSTQFHIVDGTGSLPLTVESTSALSGINFVRTGLSSSITVGTSGDMRVNAGSGGANAIFVAGANGNVGIGTITTPEKLNVIGNIKANGQIYSASFNAGAVSAIDWNNGNTQTSSNTCSALTLSNLADGGSYTLIVTDTSSTQCNFSTGGGESFRFKPANGPRTASSHTMYSFMKVGTIVYVTWTTGF